MQTLAQSYRPKTFSDVVGQRVSTTILNKMVEKGTVPQGLLFKGVYGTGKTSVARILAAALNCTSDSVKPCGTCVSCVSVESGESPDVIEIDAASNAGVADIRALVEMVKYHTSGKHRVVILDEAHNMSREAFNALLKPLEESTSTFYILVTTEPRKIPETILSRLIEFEFRTVDPKDIYDRLAFICQKEDIGVDDDLVVYLAQNSSGSVREAIMSLDLIRRSGLRTLSSYKKLISEIDAGPFMVAAMNKGDSSYTFEVLNKILSRTGNPTELSSQILQCFRDLLIIQSTDRPNLSFVGKELDIRINLARQIDGERILNAVKLLWDLKTRIRVSDNPRSNLEMVVILIQEILTKGKITPKNSVESTTDNSVTIVDPVEKPVSKKLTLAEMQQMK